MFPPAAVPCFQVDAFSHQPFKGNPAAVCLLEAAVGDAWMQSVAAEMNLAETAFVRRDGDLYSLRWFTPEVEVDLCGHATLAAAHVLWTETAAPDDRPLRFQTRSGILVCRRAGDRIAMDFPSLPADACEPRPELLTALGLSAAEWTGRTAFDDVVVIHDPAELRAVRPDFRQLAAVTRRGVMVTSISDDPQADFLSRFFAPRVGIDEDPVTGSAHCCPGLACF